MKKSTFNGKILVLLLAVSMIITFMPLQHMNGNVYGTAEKSKRKVKYDVDFNVSLSEDTKNLEISLDVSGITKEGLEEAINGKRVELKLERDTNREYVDTKLFPNQKKGGKLSSWLTMRKTPMFKNIKLTVKEDSGKLKLVADMDVDCYFADKKNKPDYSAPHIGGGPYLDICGYFDFKALIGDKEIGKSHAKVVPYDNFRTMSEIYDELNQLTYIKGKYFVAQKSMGKSTGGRNIPYLIVAKDEKAVNDWLEYTELAEKNPKAAIKSIESGKYDNLKVPVMYSNVHSNEIAATDGIMEFAWKLVENKDLSYKDLEGFTDEGKQKLKAQMGPEGEAGSTAVPDLVKDKSTYLGYLKDGNKVSGKVDLNKLYKVKNKNLSADDLLDDVFFILVPEENVDGREFLTREGANGYDFNRDNSFQTTNETAAMQNLIGKFNPVSFVEFHGRIKDFQCEPCDPPHEPNFEYDLLAEHLMTGGEALGKSAVANNDNYNSYVIPQRDYLSYTGKKDKDGKNATRWEDPWDDMSTSYTPQFAMLQGTVSYTVELPAYNDDTVTAACYGIIGQSAYIKNAKKSYMEAQAKIFERGVKNHNSDSMKEVGQWFADQNDIEGAEVSLFRPEYKKDGENKNFYPECYIIPLDGKNQKNLQAAGDMMLWLTRNDVKVNITSKPFKLGGKTYPEGTVVVSMYQAKRSVANSALYNGTLIHTWSQLYSEGITAFNKTRGFDMVTVAKPKEYNTVKLVMGKPVDFEGAKAYQKNIKSSFTGTKAAYAVINNVSEDSTSAVNKLLKSGAKVGMITAGKEKGNFITSYLNYKKVASKYRITAKGTKGKGIKAKLIKPAAVYVPGKLPDASEGYIGTNRVTWNSYPYNYDVSALKDMNFKLTEKPENAGVIVGTSKLGDDNAAMEKVKKGTPYMTYSRNSSVNLSSLGIKTDRKSLSNAMDCLGYVEYPSETLVNATYIREKDDIFYGYGCGYFENVPKGSKILVKMDGKKTPLEGFIPTAYEDNKVEYDKFLNGSIQGFSYKGKSNNAAKVDVTAFANTLTNKLHQRDEYTFISNFIFSKSLGKTFVIKKITKPAKVTKLKAKAVKGRKVVLTWKKAKAGKAYQIVYKKKGWKKYKTLAKTSKLTFKTKKLSKGAKYYFKVRAYRKVSGEIIYGAYSKSVSVKIIK